MGKEEPKKPIYRDLGEPTYAFRPHCPRCDSHIVNVWSKADYEPNYCHYCGQKLKWED